jgi:hypothetical protein
MKLILLSALLLSGSMLAVAQVKKEDLATKNTASPGAETSVTINGKNLWITTTPPPSGVATFSAAPARTSRMALYGVWAPITPLFCTPTPTST